MTLIFCISRFSDTGCGVQSVTMAGTSIRRTLCANSSDIHTPSDKPVTPTSENQSKVKSVTSLITSRNSSCGMVMFSQVSVCLSTGGGWYACRRSLLGNGYAWSQVPSGEVVDMPGTPIRKVHVPGNVHPLGRYTLQKVHPLVLTSSGGHRSKRYTSYWNAFLSRFCN